MADLKLVRKLKAVYYQFNIMKFKRNVRTVITVLNHLTVILFYSNIIL